MRPNRCFATAGLTDEPPDRALRRGRGGAERRRRTSHPGRLSSLPVIVICSTLVQACAAGPTPGNGEWASLFDGSTLSGWEGNLEYFRVEDGAIVGGADAAPIPRNEFLCTEREYQDFELEIGFALDEGVNSGVQIRSQRITGSHETIGYQADLGEGYWGAIYDESRRNRVLIAPPEGLIEEILDRDGWNRYRIVAEGPRIQLFLNGRQTVDYTEAEVDIPQRGRICLQIHSGPPGETRFFDLRIRPLGS